MSGRGRGNSQFARGRGAGRGRGFGGGRGYGGGRGRGREPEGPPSHVVELGSFLHPCENEMVYKSTNEKVPYFNAGAYLENKTRIGKIDEILGCINQVMFTVKPDAGVVATAFKSGDLVYISPDKLLPLSRFTETSKAGRGGGGRGGRTGMRNAGRSGGRTFTCGGRGFSGGRSSFGRGFGGRTGSGRGRGRSGFNRF